MMLTLPGSADRAIDDRPDLDVVCPEADGLQQETERSIGRRVARTAFQGNQVRPRQVNLKRIFVSRDALGEQDIVFGAVQPQEGLRSESTRSLSIEVKLVTGLGVEPIKRGRTGGRKLSGHNIAWRKDSCISRIQKAERV